MKYLLTPLALLLLTGCANENLDMSIIEHHNEIFRKNSQILDRIDSIDRKINIAYPNIIEQKVETIEVPDMEKSELEVCKHLILPRGQVKENTYDMLANYTDQNGLDPYLDQIFTRVLTTMIWCFDNT